MPDGELTRAAVQAQPEWLRRVPRAAPRLPPGRLLFAGCGTSFNAAQTGGDAVEALELVDAPRQADLLVLVSHEGETPVTVEAARAFQGPKWLVTGKAESTLAELCEEVVVATPAVEQSMCHTASYTCAVAALAALRGEDIGWLPEAVESALAAEHWPVGGHERYAVVGAGPAWPTAQEAALKLREGAQVAAFAHHTEEILHGDLAALDETVRAFVLVPPGRAGERAHDVLAALAALEMQADALTCVHPVVDIVPFHLFVLDLAAERGVDPDVLRRDDERWARARAAYR